MSDIFLSYESRDLDRAKVLAAALELQGWSVFYDRTIPPGKTWRQVIGEEIDKCRCMIVAWSTYSINSTWVEAEADIGLKRKILVPLLLDQVTPPLGFGAIQSANLVGWKGETDSSAYKALCNALSERLDLEAESVTDSSKVSDQTIIDPQKPKIRWSKPLILKVAKISVITVILSILLWFITPVLLNPKESQTESVDLTKESLPLTKELTTKTTNLEEYKQQVKELVVLDRPDYRTIKQPKMISIPQGSFMMGSNTGRKNEKPVHQVTIPAFSMAAYEVTFEEYNQFAATMTGYDLPDDEGWRRGKRPVINVSWDEATAYAAWLSKKTGKRYRLASEAEWEYAARAGTVSDYYWGDSKENPKDYVWFSNNSGGKTHPVGEKKPNAFGLYDMSGNVWEWVQDCYEKDYESAPKNGMALEKQGCTFRVLRGGSWYSSQADLRSEYRGWNYPGYRGSRVVSVLPRTNPVFFALLPFVLSLYFQRPSGRSRIFGGVMKNTTPQAVQACHELLRWLIPHLDKFPRVRRFTLGERLIGYVGSFRSYC